jgi:DUF971 family protein
MKRLAARNEKGGKRLRRQGSAADLDERGRQLSNHLPEEMRCTDAEENHRAVCVELDEVDEHRGRFGLRATIGEGSEVVHSRDRHRGSLHQREIEIVLHPPDERLGERGPAARDLVEVDARLRVVARVELIGRFADIDHRDVVRQQIVQLSRDLARMRVGANSKVRDLSRGVNTRIGAARPSDLGVAKNLSRCAEKNPLDGLRRVALRLPPRVARSLVFDQQSVSRHLPIPTPPRDESLVNDPGYDAFCTMRPVFYDVLGSELTVVWPDGHESYYPLEPLRRACPCATCSGESDLFGRVARGAARPLTEASLQVASLEPVGNYGLQINWADGHTYGIWTFDALRAFCCCEKCRT